MDIVEFAKMGQRALVEKFGLQDKDKKSRYFRELRNKRVNYKRNIKDGSK